MADEWERQIYLLRRRVEILEEAINCIGNVAKEYAAKLFEESKEQGEVDDET